MLLINQGAAGGREGGTGDSRNRNRGDDDRFRSRSSDPGVLNRLPTGGFGVVKLALEGGCNGVASTFGVLGAVARRYAHKIPFIVKINHNELLTYPNEHDQILFGTVERAFEMGAAAIGATRLATWSSVPLIRARFDSRRHTPCHAERTRHL